MDPAGDPDLCGSLAHLFAYARSHAAHDGGLHRRRYASAVGWLIYWVMPPIVSNYQGIASRAQVLSLRSKQKKLIAAWGDEVASVVAQPYQEAGTEPEDQAEPEGES